MDEEAPPSPKLASAKDFALAVELLLCFMIAWLAPERAWRWLSTQLARLHSLLMKENAAELNNALGQIRNDLSTGDMLKEHRIACFLEEAQVFKEYRPGGWQARLQLHGAARVDDALQDGNGVILWTYSCRYGDLAIKKALKQAGYEFNHLRSDIHPYSSTKFGRQVLNPLRTRIEDRNIKRVVVLYPDKQTKAIRELNTLLRKNEIVSITAIGDGGSDLPIPFLGGQLRMKRGAIVLSRRTKAPILPVFITPKDGGLAFDVEIGEKLAVPEGTPRTQIDEALLTEYAERVLPHLKDYPHIWRGWHSRSLWTPAS